MGDDGEGEHTDGNRETDRDGVFDDVFGETVFDTFSVVLESKDEAGEADTGEIQERHFDGAEGIAKWEDDKNDGEDGSVDGFGEEEGGGAFEVVDGLAAFIDDGGDGFEAGVQEDKLGGAAGGVGAFADGEAGVGFFHCENVVDTIAGHSNGASLPLESFDEFFLLIRGDASEDGVIFGEFVVIWPGFVGEVDAS